MPQKARLQKAATFRGLSSEKFPRSATIKHRLPYGTRVSARALALFPSPRYRLRHTLSFAFYLHAATHFARQGLVQQPILRYTLCAFSLSLSVSILCKQCSHTTHHIYVYAKRERKPAAWSGATYQRHAMQPPPCALVTITPVRNDKIRGRREAI